MHIDHINIQANGELLERVKSFYEALLGLEAGFRPSFASEGYWLYAGDRPIIHLSRSERQDITDSRGSIDHVAFRSEDLGSMRARMHKLGVGFRSNYIPELDMTQLFLSDPAGTGIEINFPGEK